MSKSVRAVLNEHLIQIFQCTADVVVSPEAYQDCVDNELKKAEIEIRSIMAGEIEQLTVVADKGEQYNEGSCIWNTAIDKAVKVIRRNENGR